MGPARARDEGVRPNDGGCTTPRRGDRMGDVMTTGNEAKARQGSGSSGAAEQSTERAEQRRCRSEAGWPGIEGKTGAMPRCGVGRQRQRSEPQWAGRA